MAVQGTAAYSKAVLITKSDTVNFDGSTYSASATTKPIPCDAIFVGGTGIVVAVLENGDPQSFTCAVGEILPIRAIRVNSTTTSATLLEALYYV